MGQKLGSRPKCPSILAPKMLRFISWILGHEYFWRFSWLRFTYGFSNASLLIFLWVRVPEGFFSREISKGFGHYVGCVHEIPFPKRPWRVWKLKGFLTTYFARVNRVKNSESCTDILSTSFSGPSFYSVSVATKFDSLTYVSVMFHVFLQHHSITSTADILWSDPMSVLF